MWLKRLFSKKYRVQQEQIRQTLIQNQFEMFFTQVERMFKLGDGHHGFIEIVIDRFVINGAWLTGSLYFDIHDPSVHNYDKSKCGRIYIRPGMFDHQMEVIWHCCVKAKSVYKNECTELRREQLAEAINSLIPNLINRS